MKYFSLRQRYSFYFLKSARLHVLWYEEETHFKIARLQDLQCQQMNIDTKLSIKNCFGKYSLTKWSSLFEILCHAFK